MGSNRKANGHPWFAASGSRIEAEMSLVEGNMGWTELHKPAQLSPSLAERVPFGIRSRKKNGPPNPRLITTEVQLSHPPNDLPPRFSVPTWSWPRCRLLAGQYSTCEC